MTAGEGVVEVRLVHVPVDVWADAQEHTDALLREFALIAAAARESGLTHGVPGRLTELIARLTEQYGAMTGEQQSLLFDAAAAGQTSLPELVFWLPPAAAGAARDLATLLDEADEYCRSGEHLLTLAADDEVVHFRRWYLQEFERQVAGQPPTPWPAYRRAAG